MIASGIWFIIAQGRALADNSLRHVAYVAHEPGVNEWKLTIAIPRQVGIAHEVFSHFRSKYCSVFLAGCRVVSRLVLLGIPCYHGIVAMPCSSVNQHHESSTYVTGRAIDV
jgi:hypothetical protein